MSRSVRWLATVLLAVPLASAPAQRPAQTGGDPILRVGDQLRITAWRHPELSGDFAVAADSTLEHPVYQGVKVAGVPLSVVRERLGNLLANYERGEQFVIEPLFPVTVAGEVRQPNLYQLAQGTTFAQAIAHAGGPTELGRLDRVNVIRRDSAMMINLGRGYSRYAALTIESGDQVLVARGSSLNVLRDVLYPLTSFTAAIAALLAYTRR